jgi:molecular chaperone GrpE (heat shock protein)
MSERIERDEILRRFEALLDSALTEEEPPGGIDAQVLSLVMAGGSENSNQRGDSYTLWTAMTALTQEIKLQGRAFQELNHTLTAQTEKMTDELRSVYAERERTLQRDAERRSRREALRPLIDLRDRLGRGLASVQASQDQMARNPRFGWWARVLGKQAADPSASLVEALVRGYELAVERLDQTLDEFNVREICRQGESFDSRSMNAIESEESATVAPGTVLEIYLNGYEWNGEIFRPAQVKVSREPASYEGKE